MAKLIFVNLPVTDVERSATFYTALGFERDMRFSQQGKAAAMQWSDTISIMLLSPEFFAGFTPKAIADATVSTEVLLALSCDDRAGVDRMTGTAAANGGKGDVRPVQDMGFLYTRSFEDPDGHIFEPMYMDMEAALAAMQQQPADA